MEHVANTIIVLALLLGVLVVFHEFGHYMAAKLVGMKVHEFAFGFGPILARLFKRGETQFNFRAIPLGGFVRIAGMEPGEEEEGGFNSFSASKRAAVIFAGPFMSLVLGYIVFLLIGFVWGFPSAVPTTKVYQVMEKSAADSAGLKKGDVIVAVNSNRVANGGEVSKAIRASDGKQVALTVKRDGGLRRIIATPTLDEIPGEKNKVWVLGFNMEPQMKRTGVVESVRQGTIQTYNLVTAIVTRLFSKHITRDVGGLVMIGYMTSEMVKEGAYAVFIELGILSLMLGIINLVPWPVLDGGHILYLIVEKIRGKKIEPEWWMRIQTAGVAALIFLALFLVYYDIARIVTGNIPR